MVADAGLDRARDVADADARAGLLANNTDRCRVLTSFSVHELLAFAVVSGPRALRKRGACVLGFLVHASSRVVGTRPGVLLATRLIGVEERGALERRIREVRGDLGDFRDVALTSVNKTPLLAAVRRLVAALARRVSALVPGFALGANVGRVSDGSPSNQRLGLPRPADADAVAAKQTKLAPLRRPEGRRSRSSLVGLVHLQDGGLPHGLPQGAGQRHLEQLDLVHIVVDRLCQLVPTWHALVGSKRAGLGA
mmetsp:Transcript_24765/g.57538  ORF Transcript_24765/g.57538 Transcript_24765/m.57538 type:complete len:252 (+) Transcript_24765:596-1351(+)